MNMNYIPIPAIARFYTKEYKGITLSNYTHVINLLEDINLAYKRNGRSKYIGGYDLSIKIGDPLRDEAFKVILKHKYLRASAYSKGVYSGVNSHIVKVTLPFTDKGELLIVRDKEGLLQELNNQFTAKQTFYNTIISVTLAAVFAFISGIVVGKILK